MLTLGKVTTRSCGLRTLWRRFFLGHASLKALQGYLSYWQGSRKGSKVVSGAATNSVRLPLPTTTLHHVEKFALCPSQCTPLISSRRCLKTFESRRFRILQRHCYFTCLNKACASGVVTHTSLNNKNNWIQPYGWVKVLTWWKASRASDESGDEQGDQRPTQFLDLRTR